MAKKAAAASKKPAKVKKGKEQDAPDDPVLHERIMSTGEASRLLNKAGLAVAYLVARDGMDEELAASIVEGLSSDDLHDLVTEALTAPDPNGKGMDQPWPGRSPLDAQQAQRENEDRIARSAAAQGVIGGQLVPGGKEQEPKHEYVDLLTVEGLLSDPEDIPTMIADCISAAKNKNDSEAKYKALKKRLVVKLDAAVAPHVTFGDIKIDRYQGHTVTLSQEKLLLKGVSPDIIKECWQDTPYEDIRFTVPKEAK